MQLFYAPDLTENDSVFSLPKDESHHAVKVLRMNMGEDIFVTNGKGIIIGGTLQNQSASSAMVSVNEYLPDTQKRNYRIHLAVAPTKINDRMEWFLEKATEIGVDEITPLICGRSERKVFNAERGEKIVVSAAKQSLKSVFPILNPAVDFKTFVKNNHCKNTFIAHCMADMERLLLKDAVVGKDDICILIGPEGDFSPAEVEMSLKNGYTPISLGDSRLRTETAALFSVALVNVLNQ
ncbi:MAG: 16S rRNA (uracil(1498)-N(3))-methyltransferase [Flavobacteriales bacterium]|nr:16S rRNA (uracil(1498)-N(3))-methyltransferase [Flavobacteriales bacterium]